MGVGVCGSDSCLKFAGVDGVREERGRESELVT